MTKKIGFFIDLNIDKFFKSKALLVCPPALPPWNWRYFAAALATSGTAFLCYVLATNATYWILHSCFHICILGACGLTLRAGSRLSGTADTQSLLNAQECSPGGEGGMHGSEHPKSVRAWIRRRRGVLEHNARPLLGEGANAPYAVEQRNEPLSMNTPRTSSSDDEEGTKTV